MPCITAKSSCVLLAPADGLTPDKELLRLARRDAGNVLSVPREAWAERFGEVLLGEHAATGLQFMHDCEILQRMVPEVCLMVDFHKSCPIHHKDIWDHTLQVVEKCPPTLEVRWAALMHEEVAMFGAGVATRQAATLLMSSAGPLSVGDRKSVV